MRDSTSLEYRILRDDIHRIDTNTLEVMKFTVAGFTALLSYGINQADFLITIIGPLILLFLGYRLILENAGAITRRAVYLRTFVESDTGAPRYETRLRHLRTRRAHSARRRFRVHGDSTYWLFILCGWIAVAVSFSYASTLAEQSILGFATVMWIAFAIRAARRRRYFEAGGGYEERMTGEFGEIRKTEAAQELA